MSHKSSSVTFFVPRMTRLGDVGTFRRGAYWEVLRVRGWCSHRVLRDPGLFSLLLLFPDSRAEPLALPHIPTMICGLVRDQT